PSSAHRSRSRVASTSSNHPTLRWVEPQTLVRKIGPLPSPTFRPRTGRRALDSKASCGPQSTNRNTSPTKPEATPAGDRDAESPANVAGDRDAESPTVAEAPQATDR